jgi:hypothetical protein
MRRKILLFPFVYALFFQIILKLKTMKTILLYVIFLISVALLVLNRYTALYINNSVIHLALIITAIVTLSFITGQILGKLKSKPSRLLFILLVSLLCYAKAFLTWDGDWKTQIILYHSIANKNVTVDFQMQDNRFTFGYKKRITKRLKLFPGIDWITDVDTAALNVREWKKMNLYVNELHLKSNDTNFKLPFALYR